MYAQPGKKLLFMGGEFGQRREWAHDSTVEWDLIRDSRHSGIQQWVTDLNRLYRNEPALYEQDFNSAGFEWVDCTDFESSVISLLRHGTSTDGEVFVVCNFTPVPRQNYRIGVSRGGFWKEALNSDAPAYGGSGWGNLGGVEAVPIPLHGRTHSVTLTLPPLAVLYFAHSGSSS
jgi:1,4-alpha-glucan branching enzyme